MPGPDLLRFSPLGGEAASPAAVSEAAMSQGLIGLGDVETVTLPDLLEPLAVCRVDAERTELSIVLAFSGATSGGLFAETLDRARVPPSSWDPAAFAGDLFLKEFVMSCFGIRLGSEWATLSTNHLVRLLASPPVDRAVVEYRRAILRELDGAPETRRALEGVYRTLCRLRAELEGATAAAKWDANRRQLQILESFKALVDGMVAGFGEARSGLRRLAAFGQRIQAGEPYRSLVDLLRYDERLATLQLKIGVGADGRIRGFEILSVEENRENPFTSSPVRRWLAKFELFLRGFRFSDGEVMARLIDAVFEGVQAEFVALVQLLGDLEFYLGALGFCDRARAAGLGVCLPEIGQPDEPRELTGLFNPLLLVHGPDPVPCDIRTDRQDTTVLITGPNSGGKTRLLQSLGLAQVLAQSGLFIPARAGRLALVPALVVSLIEEARPDRTEGRLGTELMRIRALFERLPPGAMVILDELCSGTNPSEGEEIFELVVQMLTRLRPQAFITTHFLGFAARLERDRKIVDLRFLQVLLDGEQRPTYQFAPGVATTSLAGQTAARLGVTGEQLLSLVERNIHSAHQPPRGRGR